MTALIFVLIALLTTTLLRVRALYRIHFLWSWALEDGYSYYIVCLATPRAGGFIRFFRVFKFRKHAAKKHKEGGFVPIKGITHTDKTIPKIYAYEYLKFMRMNSEQKIVTERDVYGQEQSNARDVYFGELDIIAAHEHAGNVESVHEHNGTLEQNMLTVPYNEPAPSNPNIETVYPGQAQRKFVECGSSSIYELLNS